MRDKNSIQLCVRISPEIDNKIHKIIAETGMTKSNVVKKLLMESDDIQIKDGEKIAAELFKIRVLLEKNLYDGECKHQIKECCDLLMTEIYELFAKGGDESGDTKGD